MKILYGGTVTKNWSTAKSVPLDQFWQSQNWSPLANFSPPYENVNSKHSKVAS